MAKAEQKMHPLIFCRWFRRSAGAVRPGGSSPVWSSRPPCRASCSPAPPATDAPSPWPGAAGLVPAAEFCNIK